MVLKASKNPVVLTFVQGAVPYIGVFFFFPYLYILLQLFQEYLFVVVININLLTLINEIIIL